MASSSSGGLTANKGDLYIWPYVRSARAGTVHPLSAYVRSLPDYVIHPGKTIEFRVNGTSVGAAVVGADGWAGLAWDVPTDEPSGAHMATAAFAGDVWHEPVLVNAAFNVVP
ncbi:MAG: hypothetical protein NT029_10110 [Armatimonadetes bacterium]|nr:hypothetical protein [Armatimonadota bacterium]